MKIKISRTNGDIIEAEGTADELASLIQTQTQPLQVHAPVQFIPYPAPCNRPHADVFTPYITWYNIPGMQISGSSADVVLPQTVGLATGGLGTSKWELTTTSLYNQH